MRRVVMFVAIVVIIALGNLVPAGHPKALAQDATPSGDVEAAPFPTIDFLAFATGMELASPGELMVLRFHLEPGVALPLTPDDPIGGVFIVESGALVIQVDAPLSATRVMDLADAIAVFSNGGDFTPAVEQNEAGQILTLWPGDSVYIPGNISGEIRNDGQEVAVGLAFLAGPAGEMSEATPAP